MKVSLACNLLLTLILIVITKCQNFGANSFLLSQCSSDGFRNLQPSVQAEHICNMIDHLNIEARSDRTQIDDRLSGVQSSVINMESKIRNLVVQLQNMAKKMPKIDQYRPYGPLNGSPSLTTGGSFKWTLDIAEAEDCAAYFKRGIKESGVYPLKMTDGTVINTYCEMEAAEGGWTVIQNHGAKQRFNKNWSEYTNGFGNPNDEFWIGNRFIEQITNKREYSLRIEIADWNGTAYHAEYTNFRIDPENENFRLHVQGYSGNAGDSFSSQNAVMFSTYDSDNDEYHGQCAQKNGAGWWYNACGNADLNGQYTESKNIEIKPDGTFQSGILWQSVHNSFTYSFKGSRMMIKPKMIKSKTK